ncbi:MAG TPA: hypothetical protein VEQ67_18500 [Mycobacterium sp.]|nr:hypothetical protein [Mycobacterium sp.]
MHARLSHSLLAVAAVGVFASPLAAQNQAPAAPQITVGGVVYTQYQYTDAAVHNNTFDVTRAYVNVLGRFSGGITTRVTADIIPSAVANQQLRLKYAFAAWTPTGSSLTYKLGMMQTPFVDYEETLWDYRMQGTIAVDRNGAMTSSDIGFGVDGKWNNDQVNGQIAVVNGEGYSGGTGDFHKDLEARVSVRVKPTNDASRVGGLRLTGYAGVGKYGPAFAGNDRNRYLGQVSYRSQQFTLAGEFVSRKDSTQTGSILTAFGVYHLTGGKVAVIGRVDLVDPDKNVANNKNTRIIGGLSYQLSPNVRLLADLDRLSFESGATATNQVLLQAQFVF